MPTSRDTSGTLFGSRARARMPLVASLVALAVAEVFATAPALAQSWPPPPQTVPSIGVKNP